MKIQVYIYMIMLSILTGCSIKSNDIIETDSTFEIIEELSAKKENVDDVISNTLTFPKNAIISGESFMTYTSGEILVPNLSKVLLLNQNNDEFTIEYNDIKGKIKKENVVYHEIDKKSKYTLMLDVSQFNKGSKFFSLDTEEDFGKFIINNNINYVYIRIGGRGYGRNGKMYYDSETDFFTNACDYFGIPYGFYFIDEALNTYEAIEEANFVVDYIKDKNFLMNKLPIAIDVEYSYGKSRADNIWNNRTPILNTIIDELGKNGYDCILYANGARIDTYIKDVNCYFWSAMYPRNNKIPDLFYSDFIKREEKVNKNNKDHVAESFLSIDINMADTGKINYSDEYLKKVKAWQFTENGASENGINGLIDLSLVDNEFFLKYAE